MTSIENTTLLSTLFDQHHRLRTELAKIGLLINENSKDFGEILNHLNEFKKEILEHLKLEDGVFYPAVFEKMKKINQPAEAGKIENFISEMKSIGENVINFFSIYNNTEAIAANFSDFEKTFSQIAPKLLLRMAMEEEGVFIYLSF